MLAYNKIRSGRSVAGLLGLGLCCLLLAQLVIAKPLNQDAEDDYDYEDDDAKPSHHHHLHVHTKGTTAPPTVATGASKPPKSEASSTTPSASHLGESAVNTSSSSSGEQAAKVAKSTTAKPGLWMVGESLSFTRSSVAPKGGNTTTAALEDGPRGDKTSQLIVPIESNDDDDDAEDSTEDYDDLGEDKKKSSSSRAGEVPAATFSLAPNTSPAPLPPVALSVAPAAELILREDYEDI